jgi:hypothetical protein
MQKPTLNSSSIKSLLNYETRDNVLKLSGQYAGLPKLSKRYRSSLMFNWNIGENNEQNENNFA